ncbi:transposase domain-containing protein [Gemmobacter fulvus]|uniref:transposase domain-containing protein n=1 Tax=Gemmobacter fulvus TaxID=2840474 RepID=UPI0027965AC8|nr:transposase domain-containing protein [Gemmobacter fulvus]MDQ1847693.1 transposase domain-containing protein [Gemmobacter fulvus]
MTRTTPEKEWWTTAEIAASGLPDVPDTRQGVDALADRQDWRAHPDFARRRAGRGGGWEYSWRLLPARAQRKLLVAAKAPAPAKPTRDRAEVWAWYETLPDSVKTRALDRLLIIQKVEALEPVLGRDMAVTDVARLAGQGARTIWGWLALIEGVRADDRLPYLAPRHRATVRSRCEDCDPEFFAVLKSDFLRLAQPSFSSCYRRTLRIAAKEGWATLPERTMRRRLDAAVSHVTQVLCRKGIDAVKRLYPPQVRDKSALHALEAVNADFHKFDVFVRWPKMPGQTEPAYVGRPQMVAFQDIHSGRILAWRVDQTPNSTAVLLAAGDMIEDWGIPQHVLMDNGREFAAKSITGGAATRYRFKVKDDDIPGLFTALGCEIHWATPYSGQSKPIERAFRDMCDSIAKDPRFDGAWTGNKPEAKPEDYGSRAIELEDFLRVVGEGIEEHNIRTGRRSEVAFGRSFAEVFDESYAKAPIRKATEAQRRLWLMGAEGLRAHSKTGEVAFQGNRYWGEWMKDVSGERVIIRFDPADLWAGLHVYSQDNAYLGHAPCLERKGVFDIEEARITARERRRWLKAEKEAAAAHRRYTAAELGRHLDEIAPIETAPPEAKVVRPTFGKKVEAPPAPPVVSADLTSAHAALVADFESRRRVKTVDTPAEESARARFRRALDLEGAIAAKQPVTKDQRKWLSGYQTSSEYRAERILWETHGDLTDFG